MRAVLVLSLLPIVAGCVVGAMPSDQGRDSALYASLGARYEAREWLERNRSEAALASNRFPSTRAGRSYVDSLYALGALKVEVTNVRSDSGRLAREGGPYSDALLITLPADTRRRATLFRLNAAEAIRGGFEPEPDRGQILLYFWWD
jgi:hypothetical protein